MAPQTQQLLTSQGNYYLWVLLVVYVVVGGDEILSHEVSRVVLGTVSADAVLVLLDERFKSGLDVPSELDSGVLELALKVLGTVEPNSGLKKIRVSSQSILNLTAICKNLVKFI